MITLYDAGSTREMVSDGELAYLVGKGVELTILNIADPAQPELVGRCETPGESHGIDLAGGYAYIADRLMGMLVVEITDPR